MRFSPDGKTLAALCENTVRLWDVAAKRSRAVINLTPKPDDKAAVTSPLVRQGAIAFAFTGASDLLATMEPARGLRLWRLDGTPAGPSGKIQLSTGSRALALRPDGLGLLLGDANGSIWRWKLTGEQDKKPLQFSKGPVVWLDVDRNSEQMFAATSTGIGIATYPNGLTDLPEPIAVFQTSLQIDSAALSLEQDSIVTKGVGGVRLWPADWRVALKESCQRLSNHIVFQIPGYAASVDEVVVTLARQVCQAQMWK